MVFLCVVAHAATFALGWVLPLGLIPRVGGILVIDTLIVAAFARSSRRVALWHRGGASRGAFLERLWDKPWRETSWAIGPVDASRDESFYRRVLPDDAEHRDALYTALSSREAARLALPASAPSLLATLAGSTLLALLSSSLSTFDAIVFNGYMLPFTVSLFLEAPLDLLARRSMLRRGDVERATVLIARNVSYQEPLVDRRTAGVLAVLVVAFVVLPLAVVGVVLYRSGGAPARDFVTAALRGLALVPALLVPYQLALHFAQNRMPFTKFLGPVSISLLLDIQSRGRYLLNSAVGIYGLVAAGLLLFPGNTSFASGFAGAAPFWSLLYAMGLFDDQRDGPGVQQDLEYIRERLDRALRQIPATP